MTARWLLVLALIPSTAFAAHPLCIDDAGTVAAGTRELELSSQILDLDTGREHGFGAAGRLGLTRQLDAGLAALWVPAPADGDVWEFLLDLKWAPGYAVDWRPRPFLRPDFALLVGGGQAEVSMAGLHAGLSWEGRRGLLTAELGWIEPLDRDFGSAEAWRETASRRSHGT